VTVDGLIEVGLIQLGYTLHKQDAIYEKQKFKSNTHIAHQCQCARCNKAPILLGHTPILLMRRNSSSLIEMWQEAKLLNFILSLVHTKFLRLNCTFNDFSTSEVGHFVSFDAASLFTEVIRGDMNALNRQFQGENIRSPHHVV
jgi:hypothetical protein